MFNFQKNKEEIRKRLQNLLVTKADYEIYRFQQTY